MKAKLTSVGCRIKCLGTLSSGSVIVPPHDTCGGTSLAVQAYAGGENTRLGTSRRLVRIRRFLESPAFLLSGAVDRGCFGGFL